MNRIIERLAILCRCLAIVAALVVSLLVIAPPAPADTNYDPPGAWNGKRAYMSVACHDRADGVPGGPCITNTGCSGYSENLESSAMANTSIFGSGTGANLMARGYKARKGDGTVDQNVANSNQWGANIHVPLHSNARAEGCGNTTASLHGTWASIGGPNDTQCANQLIQKVGSVSPGTTDVQWDGSGNVEVNTPNAPTCYLEADFHTWNSGRNWLVNEVNWTYKIGASLDVYFGF